MATQSAIQTDLGMIIASVIDKQREIAGLMESVDVYTENISGYMEQVGYRVEPMDAGWPNKNICLEKVPDGRYTAVPKDVYLLEELLKNGLTAVVGVEEVVLQEIPRHEIRGILFPYPVTVGTYRFMGYEGIPVRRIA